MLFNYFLAIKTIIYGFWLLTDNIYKQFPSKLFKEKSTLGSLSLQTYLFLKGSMSPKVELVS